MNSTTFYMLRKSLKLKFRIDRDEIEIKTVHMFYTLVVFICKNTINPKWFIFFSLIKSVFLSLFGQFSRVEQTRGFSFFETKRIYR